MVRPKKISEFKPLLTNVAQTSHYQVFFDGLSPDLFTFLGQKNVDRRFITENSGLLCSAASIPGSALATSDIFGNFTGVQEKFAHTRIFSEMSLEFYVDKDYKMIKFFEHWDGLYIKWVRKKKNYFFLKGITRIFLSYEISKR